MVQEFSDGKYDNWSEMMKDTEFLKDPEKSEVFRNAVAYMSNPGAILGGLAGGAATGTVGFTPRTTPRLVTSRNLARVGAMGVEGVGEPQMFAPRTTTTGRAYPRVSTTLRNGKGYGKYNGKGQQFTSTDLVPVQNPDVMTTSQFTVPVPYMHNLWPYVPLHLDREYPGDPDQPTTPPWIPDVNFYNTAQDWGSLEFQRWWRENAPGNEGKILRSPWGLIKIEYGDGRQRNFAGHVAPGVYPQGTNQDVRVMNLTLPPIDFEGAIGAGQVGVTPVRFVDEPIIYGETETFRNGGIISYADYLK